MQRNVRDLIAHRLIAHRLIARRSSLTAHRSLLGAQKSAYKPKPPSRAVLASWVELLSYQAGGGHYYEDVGCILTLQRFGDNIVKVLGNHRSFTGSYSIGSGKSVRRITVRTRPGCAPQEG